MISALGLDRLPAERLQLRSEAKQSLDAFTREAAARLQSSGDEFLRGEWVACGAGACH